MIYLWDRDEVPYIHHLNLVLKVNDEVRQNANTSQLLFKPAETLTELSGVMNFSVGDLLMTGTAGGVALKLSSELIAKVSDGLVSPVEKNEINFRQS